MHFGSFCNRKNYRQYPWRRPVQDSGRSNIIHSMCTSYTSGNGFLSFISFIFFLVFFKAGHIKSKQIDEKWTKMRLGNFVIQRNREVDTNGGKRKVYCHNISPVLLMVSEITFNINCYLRSFTTDLLAIIKYYLQCTVAVSLKAFFLIKK